MSDTAAMRAAFTAIYREDQWTNGSGPGALPDATIEYRAFLARFMEANAVRSVTDLGCGDWQSSRFIDWSRVSYLGFDVVPSIVDRNLELHAAAGVEFRLFQSPDDLPGGDLLIGKHILQHLPNDTVAEYLAAFSRRYRYLILTDSIEPAEDVNIDIDFGGYRPLRLERAPFNARGAVIFTFFTHYNSQFWKSAAFLMIGGPNN
jgi:hypothetical protein